MTERASREPEDGCRTLAASVLAHAAKEMRAGRGPQPERVAPHEDKARLRIEATVWLASRGATRWFDACGLDQRYALGRMRWSSHAQELLAAGSVHLDPGKTGVLERGLDVVDFTD